MILPGHVAASVLCHRHLKVALWPALVAGVFPDLVDKFLYYVLRVVPSSRTPMHTLWGWLGSTLLLGLLAWALDRTRSRAWLWSWFVGFSAHLLCDSPLVGGKLPFLWPLRAYTMSSSRAPLSYLFDGGPWPLWTLTAELLLVLLTLATSSRFRRWWVARRPPAKAS
jgi:membrane-bound metal-dependent hydrolase YbcI (DUF457 family)